MNSIQSNALEPTRSELKGSSGGQKLMRLLPVYGLVILMAFLILLFSVLLPNTFPTLLNLRSIVSDKAIILILSLGVMSEPLNDQYESALINSPSSRCPRR